MVFTPPYLAAPPTTVITQVIARAASPLSTITEMPPSPPDPNTITYRKVDMIDRPLTKRDPRNTKKINKASRPRWRQ